MEIKANEIRTSTMLKISIICKQHIDLPFEDTWYPQ